MKQTSIEWLINELKKSKHYQQMINEVHQNSTIAIDIIEQAKQMHKEEIVKAFGYELIDGEQYYQETYGGNYE